MDYCLNLGLLSARKKNDDDDVVDDDWGKSGGEKYDEIHKRIKIQSSILL